MSVLDTVNERLLMYMGMAYCGYRLWTWYYSESGKLYYTNCPYAEELRAFFCLGGCLDYALESRDDPAVPLLMSDSIGLVWLGEFVHQQGEESRLLIAGPAFSAPASSANIEDSLKKLNLSMVRRNRSVKLLLDVPVVSHRDFQVLARILHYYIGFEDSENLKLRYQETKRMMKQPEETDADFDGNSFREQMLLQYIREGNMGYQDFIASLQGYGDTVFAEGNPIRSTKNSAIIFTSQCAHAAMEGGVPAKIAKEMEASFIRRIEEKLIYTDLMNTMREMMDSFVNQVLECRSNHMLSPEIRLCCAYIKKNIAQPLPLQDLAAQIGYTEYYLSRKFQKEMGIKLLDYIKQVRLDYAKIMLSTTNLTIQEISERLQFGTRGYFTRIFKERIGVSPAKFRQSAMGNIVEKDPV